MRSRYVSWYSGIVSIYHVRFFMYDTHPCHAMLSKDFPSVSTINFSCYYFVISRDRRTAKDRMRRMREKRKADDQNASHTNKENHVILTRQQREKQRKKWREAKQRYR